MAQAKQTEKTVDLTEKVTLYAPKDAKYHAAGEAVDIHPLQVDHFKKHGFTEEPKTDKKTDK